MSQQDVFRLGVAVILATPWLGAWVWFIWRSGRDNEK